MRGTFFFAASHSQDSIPAELWEALPNPVCLSACVCTTLAYKWYPVPNSKAMGTQYLFHPQGPETNFESCHAVLTFESVDEIICDHSNQSSSALLSHGAVCFAGFYERKCVMFH